MLDEDLIKLGLSDKEIKVYLTLLEYNKGTGSGLARLTDLNRTTVYSVLKELIKKGLVVEDISKTPSTFIAHSPESLNRLANRERIELQEKQKLIDNLVPKLHEIHKKDVYPIPKVVFIQEDELENFLYKQSEKWSNSIIETKSYWWGFQDSSFVNYYEKWIDWYWEQGPSQSIELRLLSNEKAESIKKKKFTNRRIKYWDRSNNFSATTWICGDYIIMITTEQRPHYLVEIHDKVMAANLRELFIGIWEQTKNTE